jgi:hypothetical protein
MSNLSCSLRLEAEQKVLIHLKQKECTSCLEEGEDSVEGVSVEGGSVEPGYSDGG